MALTPHSRLPTVYGERYKQTRMRFLSQGLHTQNSFVLHHLYCVNRITFHFCYFILLDKPLMIYFVIFGEKLKLMEVLGDTSKILRTKI